MRKVPVHNLSFYSHFGAKHAGRSLPRIIMSSRVPSVFDSLANQLEVFYSDKLLLEEWGVRAADEFFFRLPSAETLENLLSDKIFPNTAATDGDGRIVVSPKEGGTPAALREWLRGPAAAAIRRLWEASKAAAKRDLAKLTEDKAEGDLPSRLTAPHVSDLATRCRARPSDGIRSRETGSHLLGQGGRQPPLRRGFRSSGVGGVHLGGGVGASQPARR